MFTVITPEAFSELQVNAGVLLKSFNPASPAAPAAADIITATTGGIQATCKSTLEDWGSDVDNCPANMAEFQFVNGWECKLATTAIGSSPETIKLALGSAAIVVADGKIVPRAKLNLSDFISSIWWVGDRADGGFVAIELKNALSTGGFSLKTTKNGKGQLALELSGFFRLASQTEVPMVFYSISKDIGLLTVVSAAGSTTGKTALTVSGHTLGSSESYVYKVADSAQTVTYGDDLSEWTAWNGSADITAATGKKITVAVVNSDSEAVAAGSATVTAAT